MATPTSFPAPHIVLPREAHKYTIILLHGRNSTGADFAEELLDDTTPFPSSDAFHGCKWIFPTARSTYSEQFQEDLTEWFDLASTSDPYAEPERQIPGLRASIAHVAGILREELRNLSSSHIFLGGISQGMATAAHVLLTHPNTLGGFVGISGWLPFHDQLTCFLQHTPCDPPHQHAFHGPLQHLQQFYAQELDIAIDPPADTTPSAGIATPMLTMHCEDDDVIDVQRGRDACSTLRTLGAVPTLKVYAVGGHETNEKDGYNDLAKFLTDAIDKIHC